MTRIKCTIPLKNVKMNADICNNICQFTLNQTYVNDESKPIEVEYIFPLSSGTSVYDFKATINDDILIETQIAPKDSAIQTYNEAIKKGDQAVLMEQSSGEVFAICLGNVPPKATVQIQIRSVSALHTEIDACQLRLNVPLTIMPHYTPVYDPSELSLILDSIMDNTSPTKPYDFILEGQIYMTDGIVSLDSKTHKIKVSKMQSHQLNFEISPENLDQDIVLSITRNKPMSFVVSESDPSVDPIYKFASQINIIPDYSKVPEPNIESAYIIVLDRSGSMIGADFVNCVKSAKIFIAYLPFEAKFNIYEFGDTFTKFNSQMVTSSPDSKQSAIKWLDSLVCKGGTEVLPVMEDIYATLKTTSGTVIFMSDGGVSNTDSIIRLVNQNRNVKVYTIGIGQSVSQPLIQRMADTSGAIAEFINSGDDQLREKVLAQLRRIQQSMRKCQQNNEIKIEVDGPYRTVCEPKTLYEGDVNTFYVFSSEPIRSVTYNQYDSDNILLGTNVLHASNVSMVGSSIHKMAGMKLIDSILDESDGSPGSQIPRLQQLSVPKSKEEIIKISQSLGILSKYTAFVGVMKNKTSDGIVTPILKRVPLQRTNKYKFDINKMLPNEDDWFDIEPILSTKKIRGTHLLHPKVQVGVNTVGSSLRNGSYDIRADIPNPKIHVSPWIQSPIEPDMQAICNSVFGQSGDLQSLVDTARSTTKESTMSVQSLCYTDCSPSTVQTSRYRAGEVLFDKNKMSTNKLSNNVPNPKNNTSPLINIIKPNSSGRFCDTRCDDQSDTTSFSCNSFDAKKFNGIFDAIHNTQSVSPDTSYRSMKPSITPSYIVTLKLDNYMVLDTILTSTRNTVLPFVSGVAIGDWIELTMEGIHNGLYKVISMGSTNSPWVLEKY